MRTFHNIELIEEVIENPYGTIGQRKYNLFKSYSFAFDWYTEVQYNENIKIIIEKMPSIEEYVTAQIGENNNRTVRFDYYIGWVSEDSRELFERCFDKIREYENANPIDPTQYSFKLKQNFNEIDLRNQLKAMIIRPGMYGFDSLSDFRAFLDGYFKFKNQYGLKLSEYETRLCTFIEHWRSKINKDISFETWDRPFRLECMGTTDFSGSSVHWEFKRLEEILNEKLKMDLEDPIVIK